MESSYFGKCKPVMRKQYKNVQSFPSHSVISLQVGCFECAGFICVLSFLQALFKPNNSGITHGTFKSMSKILCNQDITPLFFESLLPDFGDPVSNSSHAEDVYVQKLMRKYGIPQDSSKSGFSLGHKHFRAELCYFQTALVLSYSPYVSEGCKCSLFMVAEDLHCPNYWWFISINVQRENCLCSRAVLDTALSPICWWSGPRAPQVTAFSWCVVFLTVLTLLAPLSSQNSI